jgi:hypothetical protein
MTPKELENLRLLFQNFVEINNNTKLLGKGANGAVYNIGRDRILKHLTTGKHFRGGWEAIYQRKAGEEGIAPKILRNHNVNITTKHGFFVMEKLPPNTITEFEYDTILRDGGLKPNVNKNKKILEAFEKLHKLGISHGNAHQGNLMFTIDPKTFQIKKVWIIDFGRASIIPAGQTEQSVYKPLPPVYNPNYPGLRMANNGTLVRPNRFMRPGLSEKAQFSGINRRGPPNIRLNTLSANNLRKLVRKHSKGPRRAALNIAF